MNIELISWTDAVSTDDWTDIKIAKELKPYLMHSVGFVLNEDKECVVIALTWDFEGDSVSQFLSIPKRWIKDRQVVRPKRKLKG